MNKETLLERCQREAREKWGRNIAKYSMGYEEMDEIIANTLKQVSEEIGVMIENESQSFGDKNGRKVCWSCYEDGYCSHKIKIEALTDAQKVLVGEDNK